MGIDLRPAEPADRVARTAIRVSPGSGGSRCAVRITSTRSDPTAAGLRAVLVEHDARAARVALVPDGALLLGGDRVEIDVTVDADARLELVEPGGTVAYDMRGGRAGWDVTVDLGPRARLVWAGEPFVVCAGADTHRSTVARLAADARIALRETVVLGRQDEPPGTLRQQVTVERDGAPVQVEELTLGPGPAPALLGGHRVLASVLYVGPSISAGTARDHRFDLDDGSILWRRLGTRVHETTLRAAWSAARTALLTEDWRP